MVESAQTNGLAGDWLTWSQAAELVGCPVPTIDWYSRQSRITSRPHHGARPCLLRESVEEFAQWWRLRRADRDHRRESQRTVSSRRRADALPSDVVWLNPGEAAERLGVSRASILRFLHLGEGDLVAVRRGNRVWFDASSVEALAGQRREWVSATVAGAIAG